MRKRQVWVCRRERTSLENRVSSIEGSNPSLSASKPQGSFFPLRGRIHEFGRASGHERLSLVRTRAPPTDLQAAQTTLAAGCSFSNRHKLRLPLVRCAIDPASRQECVVLNSAMAAYRAAVGA